MSGECNRSALGCNNPCSQKEPANTAACETASSQVENFSLNFFGEIFKTEVNGDVNWSLPCRLDVGLPNNLRGATEPLGCYILRLLQGGAVGAKGEPGETGTTGQNGRSPYVQVSTGFSQPPVGVAFSIRIFNYNPTILPSMDVFIEGSGWYEILDTDETLDKNRYDPARGLIVLVLRKSVVNPVGFIPAGTYLLPSGKIGADGPRGKQGIQGIQGPPGGKGPVGDVGIQGIPAPQTAVVLPFYSAKIPTFTCNFGNLYQVPVQTYFGYQGGLGNTFVPLVLYPGAVPCTITLPKAGNYLLMARCGYGITSASADPNLNPPLVLPVYNFGINDFEMKNISTGTVIPQSTARIGSFSAGSVEGGYFFTSLIVSFCQTLAPNNQIQLFAKSVSGAGYVAVRYFWAFRLS